MGRIEEDSEPLVRYANLETDFPSVLLGVNGPEAFFDLPQDARLAKVRKLTGGGEEVAKLISYGVDQLLNEGKVSEIELFDILSDYLNKPQFKDRYVEDRLNYDGFGQFMEGKDIEALWELVLKVPESTSLSYVLIEHLPERAGLSSGIPEHVLAGMSDRQLRTLFDRPDIGLQKLRKQKFFEVADIEGDEKNYAKEFVQSAAISHAFDLTNEEFSEVLSKPDKARIKILKNLAWAMDLRLCLYEAIHDALWVSNVSPGGADYEHAEWARRGFERKLENLTGDRRDRELKELRLYRLAEQAAPWKKDKKGYPPSGKLAFLSKAVIEDDTWATFVAFSKCWEEERYRTKGLEKYLPRIWDAGEDDFEPDEEEHQRLEDDNANNADHLTDRIVSRLSDLLATARDESGGDDSKIAEALGKLSTHATVAQEELLQAANSTRAELDALKRVYDRQRILTWAVVGLLVILLFVKR